MKVHISHTVEVTFAERCGIATFMCDPKPDTPNKENWELPDFGVATNKDVKQYFEAYGTCARDNLGYYAEQNESYCRHQDAEMNALEKRWTNMCKALGELNR